jgi:hypothetical protein
MRLAGCPLSGPPAKAIIPLTVREIPEEALAKKLV